VRIYMILTGLRELRGLQLRQRLLKIWR